MTSSSCVKKCQSKQPYDGSNSVSGICFHHEVNCRRTIVLCCHVLHIVVCLLRMCVQVSFLKDLSGMWRQFDDRLLHHRVLPPVVSEMRNGVVALAALPLVLEIMGDMKPEGFAARSVHISCCRIFACSSM